VPRLLHDLAIARADGSYSLELSRLARTDVLILDDWGLGPLSDSERRDVLEIVEDRAGRRSTIVTSCVSPV
jgi:DNA replication protein DnaC